MNTIILLSLQKNVMPSVKSILLPMTYLGPLQLYSRYYTSQSVLIEQFDSYQKQTYRNRCEIYGANGRHSLVIPVKHEKGKRLMTKDVRIDYDTDWRRLHWKGIESAYRSSPYFEYYCDFLEPFYRREFIFLVDLCLRLNEEVLRILHIPNKPVLTNEFIFPGSRPDVIDLRLVISPKVDRFTDKEFHSIEYSQVFQTAHGFIPNLSILDLIFNLGPECGAVLRASLLEQ